MRCSARNSEFKSRTNTYSVLEDEKNKVSFKLLDATQEIFAFVEVVSFMPMMLSNLFL